MIQRNDRKQAVPNKVEKNNVKKTSIFQKYAAIRLDYLLSKMTQRNFLTELKKLDLVSKDCRSRQITQQTNYTANPQFQHNYSVSVDIKADKQPSLMIVQNQDSYYSPLLIDDVSKLKAEKLNLKQQIKDLVQQSQGEMKKLRDYCNIRQSCQSDVQNIFLSQQGCRLK